MKTLRYSKFKLQPLKNHKFKVVLSVKVCDIIIPSGFISDGASIPRLFWVLFPPNRTDYLPCAVLHDYLCDKGEYKKADECFKQCLHKLEVDKFSRVLLYSAVRIYHKLRYGV